MEIKTLQVFYGKDGLPYKDKDRQVHFPIAGTGFLGASNTTKIKFYYDELDNTNQTTWVAVSKLPNGRVGSRVLESYLDDELNEHYALLELDNYYTQYKGDVFISLQGYQGGVNVDYDEEDSQYEIHGTPTIAATGSIKFTINYANQFVGSGETDNINFQRVLATLGTKLGMRAYSEHVEELPSEGNPNVFYVIKDDPNNPKLANIYIWNENTQHYIWVGDNSLYLGNYYTKANGERLEQEIEDTNDRIDQLGGMYIFKGSKTVAQINALTGMTAGDAYNVTDSGTITTGSVVVSAGDNVAWNGTAWDKLSNSIDLSNYATTSDLLAYQVKYALANVRYYNSLALANADIDNLAIDQMVFIKDANGNLVPYHKVEDEPSLVKFEFADLVQALTNISATYLPKTQAQTQYQKKLTAGTNIYIDQETGVISASGGTVIKVNDLTGLPYATENDLPTASAGTMGAIYLVASARPTTENQCDEYITVHNENNDTYKWECIGTTVVDLTNYCTLNTVQTISADKTIAYGKKLIFSANDGGVSDTILEHNGNDLVVTGGIAQGGTYSNVDDDGNIVSQLGYDVGESGGYVAAFYGIVGIYNVLDSDNNEVENSIDFCKADGTLTTQLYADKVEFDIDSTTKTITWTAIYNAVNNALINGSGTATTVAIGNSLGYPNIAESVLIGVEASASSSSRNKMVVIGYRARGGTNCVVIGNSTSVSNGTKSVVIGGASQLSDLAADSNDVLIGYGVTSLAGTGHTMIGAGTQVTPATESDPSKVAEHDIILGNGSANTLKNNFSIDGPSRNRTMWFYDPTKILFRNENVDMAKRTQSAYINLKTLNDYLFGTGVSVTSTNAEVTVTYDHIVLGYDGIVRGVLKIEIGNNNVAPYTTIGTISEEPSSDIFIVGSDGDSVFVQFKIDTSGNIIAIDELNNSNTYCLNIVY